MTKTAPTTIDLSWSSPYLRHLLRMYWLTEPHFSEDTLNKLRSPQPVVPLRPKSHIDKWRGEFILDEGKCSQLGPTVDDDIHPIWTFKNVITDLPMEEVWEQLLPTCRLATKLTTNNRVLEWFSHVLFAHETINEKGLCVLQYNPYSQTAKALGTVKHELLRLAGNIHILWFSELRKCGDSTSGIAFHRVQAVIKRLEAQMDVETMPAAFYYEGFDDCEVRHSIWLNIRFFHQLMRQRHDPNFPARVARHTSLYFAINMVHELAHIWVDHCHRTSNGKFVEPLIMHTDIFPEAGASFDKFLVGARIFPSLDCDDVNLGSQAGCLFSNSFDDDGWVFYADVPQTWVDQWFLKSTWASFIICTVSVNSWLGHQSTKSSISRSIVSAARVNSIILYIYHKGFVVEGCCDSICCNAREPGNNFRWPCSPAKVRHIYSEIWRRDKYLAQCAGVFNPDLYLNNHYEHLKRLMDPSSNEVAS